MKNIIAITSLLAAGTAFLSATEYQLQDLDARKVVSTTGTPDYSNSDIQAGDKFIVSGTSQLFLNAWNNSHVPFTFLADVELNGEGYQVEDREHKNTFRIHEGITMSGTISVAGDSTIWSSGRENTLNGKVTGAENTTLTIAGGDVYNGATALLNFTNEVSLANLTLNGANGNAGKSAQIKFSYAGVNTISGALVSGFTSTSVVVSSGSTLKIGSADYAGTLSLGGSIEIAVDETADRLGTGTIAGAASLGFDFSSIVLEEKRYTLLQDTTLSYTGELSDFLQVSGIDGASWITQWDYSGNELSLIVSSVPEPSAFGLLAGAGALALVAARRRRRKA